MVTELPKVKIGNKTFIVDKRLNELRNTKDISDKISPQSRTPSIDELKRSFIRDTGILSSPTLRNARLFASGFNISKFGAPPLQSTGGLQIYTTSMKKLKEGELVIALTGQPLYA